MPGLLRHATEAATERENASRITPNETLDSSPGLQRAHEQQPPTLSTLSRQVQSLASLMEVHQNRFESFQTTMTGDMWQLRQELEAVCRKITLTLEQGDEAIR
jgi:hypothetical protein